MIYLLLKNGRGLLRNEIVALESKELRFSFASDYAEIPTDIRVQIGLDDHSIIKPLVGNECIVPLTEEYEGSVNIIVNGNEGRWVCDPIYIGKDKDGKRYAMAKASYGDEIARLEDEVIKQSETIVALEKRLARLEKKYEYVEDGHYLI